MLIIMIQEEDIIWIEDEGMGEIDVVDLMVLVLNEAKLDTIHMDAHKFKEMILELMLHKQWN